MLSRKEVISVVWRTEIKRLLSFLAGDNTSKNKISRFIFSYLAVILICTTVMATIVYNYIDKKTESTIIDTNNSTLLNFRNTTDDFILKNIDNIALSILSGEDIFINLFTSPLDRNIYAVNTIYDRLKSLASLNSIITDISIYYKSNNVVISTKGIKYLDKDSNQPDSRDIGWISRLNGMSTLYEWMEPRKTVGKETNPSYSVNTITLLRKYPISYNSYLGGIAISLDESRLHQLIKNTASENIQQIIIVNEKGIIISHSDESLINTPISDLPFGKELKNFINDSGYFITQNDGKKIAVSYAASGYNSWKYVTVNYTDQQAERYKFLYLLLLYFVISLILICLLALILSLKRIIRANSEVKDLSSILREQENEIQKNRGVVRQNFYMNLIDGIYQKEDEIKDQLKLLKIDYSHPCYAVAVIKLYGEKASDVRTFEYTKLKIVEYSEAVFREMDINCLCTQSKKSVILILNIRDNDANCKEIIRKICGYIFNELGFKACAGISDVCGSPLKIAEAYGQAMACINYGYLLNEKYIFVYQEIKPLESSKNTISDTYLEKFTSALHIHNKKEAIHSVHDLTEDISHNTYSYNRVITVLMQFTAVLENFRKKAFKGDRDCAYDDLFYNFSCCENITDFTVLIENFLDEWIVTNESYSSMRNKELIERIKLYISSNISRQTVSLNSVADAMHISPNYLSRIFKEETGMYFIDYLIEARLEMSKDLLLCSDMRIESIAETAGYSSLMYYSRIFKSRYGVTPKQYRMENMKV